LRKLALIAAAFAMLAGSGVHAQGDLLVAPTRVEIDGRGSAQVILSNIGAEEATYRVSLELRRMNTDGTLGDVVPEEVSAAEEAVLEMVRFSPRRVVLAPGQPQTVRVSARPDPALPDGEYRAHTMVQALPKVEAVNAEDAAAAAGDIAIRLIPVYGITIPVIVRKGQLQAVAALNNPRVVTEEGVPVLRIEMTRTGDRSTFGEIRVIKPGLPDPVLIAR